MGKDQAKQTVSGEEFASHVRAWAKDKQRTGDPFPPGTAVIGEVDLRGLHCPTNLTLKEISFKGPVNLAGSRVEGWLDLSGCRFRSKSTHAPLDLSESRIESALRLTLARFPSEKTNPEEAKARSKELGPSLQAFSLMVGGDVWLRGALIEGDVNLYNARIGGLLWGNPSEDNKRLKVSGDLLLVGARIGSWLDLKGAQIDGDLSLWGATIEQGIAAYAIGENRLQIGGDARLFRCTVNGAVRLSGAEIHGTLYIEQSRFGSLVLRAAVIQDKGGFRAVRARVACLAASGIRIDGRADLSGLLVSPSDRTDRGAKLLEGNAGVIELHNARIGATLKFWTPLGLRYSSFMSGNLPASWNEVASDGLNTIATRIDLTSARIGGDLRLDGVHLTEDLRLCNATISGDLRWRTLPATDPLGVVAKAELQADSCGKVAARSIRVGGNADFSGVGIGNWNSLCGRRGGGAPSPEERDGVLDLRYARIRGRCALYTPASSDSTAAYTCVSGSFYADAASMGELVISGESFPRHATSRIHENEPVVRLERAKVTRVRIVEPIPVRIDLTHIEVDRWELPAAHAGDIDTEPSDERATPYCDLLVLTCPKKRSNYIMFERVLRDRGSMAAADAIYREMRKEFRPPQGHRFRTVLWRLHSQTGFGTQWGKPIALIAVLAIASILVFAPQGAVEEHPVVMGSKAEAKERWEPDETGFENLRIAPVEGLGDRMLAATAMVLRYHIPMIELPMYEDHRPAGWRRTYATAMAIAHWIILPLILASLIPAIIRRRENER